MTKATIVKCESCGQKNRLPATVPAPTKRIRCAACKMNLSGLAFVQWLTGLDADAFAAEMDALGIEARQR